MYWVLALLDFNGDVGLLFKGYKYWPLKLKCIVIWWVSFVSYLRIEHVICCLIFFFNDNLLITYTFAFHVVYNGWCSCIYPGIHVCLRYCNIYSCCSWQWSWTSEEEEENVGLITGSILMCNGKIKDDYYVNRVFGSPRRKLELVIYMLEKLGYL